MKTKLILFLFLTINLGVPLGFIPFNEASAQEFTNSTGTYFDFNNGTVNHLTFANGTAVPQIVIPDPATPPDFAQLSETPFTISYDLVQFPDQALNIIDNGNTITIENKGVSSVYNKDTCSLSLFNPNEIETEFAKESWSVHSATWGSDNWNGLPVNSEGCETGFTNTQHTATIDAVRQNDDGIFRIQYSFDLYSIKTTVYYTNYNEDTFGGINYDGSVWYGNPTKFGFVNSFSDMQTDVSDLQDGFTQSGTDFVINEQHDIEYKFLDSTRLLWGINNNGPNIYIDFKNVSKPTQYGQSQVIDPHLVSHPNEPQNVDAEQTEVLKIDLDWDLPVDSTTETISHSVDNDQTGSHSGNIAGQLFQANHELIGKVPTSLSMNIKNAYSYVGTDTFEMAMWDENGVKQASFGTFDIEDIDDSAFETFTATNTANTVEMEADWSLGLRNDCDQPSQCAGGTGADGGKLFIRQDAHGYIGGVSDTFLLSHQSDGSTGSVDTNVDMIITVGYSIDLDDPTGYRVYESGTVTVDPKEDWTFQNEDEFNIDGGVIDWNMSKEDNDAMSYELSEAVADQWILRVHDMNWTDDDGYMQLWIGLSSLDANQGYTQSHYRLGNLFFHENGGGSNAGAHNYVCGGDTSNNQDCQDNNSASQGTNQFQVIDPLYAEMIYDNGDFTTSWYQTSDFSGTPIAESTADYSSYSNILTNLDQIRLSNTFSSGWSEPQNYWAGTIGSIEFYNDATDTSGTATHSFDFATTGDGFVELVSDTQSTSTEYQVTQTYKDVTTQEGYMIGESDYRSESFDYVSAKSGSGSDDVYEMDISADGTKLYFSDGQDDGLYQIPLSTPFDITTDGTPYFFDLGGNVDPYSMDFNADGTMVYYYGSDNDYNNRYWAFDLPTAWDLSSQSSSSYSNAKWDINIQNDIGSSNTILDVTWSADGTKMYVNTAQDQQIHLFDSFNEPFLDTSSPSYTYQGAVLDCTDFGYAYNGWTPTTMCYNHEWNDDGTKLYIGSYSEYKEFSVSTAWDLSSTVTATGNTFDAINDGGVTGDSARHGGWGDDGEIWYQLVRDGSTAGNIYAFDSVGDVTSSQLSSFDSGDIDEEFTYKVSALNEATSSGLNEQGEDTVHSWCSVKGHATLQQCGFRITDGNDLIGADIESISIKAFYIGSSGYSVIKWYNDDGTLVATSSQVNNNSLPSSWSAGFPSTDTNYNAEYTFTGSNIVKADDYFLVQTGDDTTTWGDEIKQLFCNTGGCDWTNANQIEAVSDGIVANDFPTWDANVDIDYSKTTTYESDLSSSTSWTLTDDLPAPTNLTAQSGIPIQLDWDDVANAVTYQVYRDSGSGFTLLANAGSDSDYDDSSTVAGTSYDYKVSALGPNPANLLESALSSQVTATAGQPPDAITSVTASISNAQTDPHVVTLTWGEPSDWQTGTPQSYEVFESVGSSGNMQSVSSALTYVAGTFTHTHNISGIQPLTDYYYLVRATSTHGTSADSNIPSVTTVDVPVKPDTPVATQPDTTATPYLVSLSWSDNGDGGSDIKGHQIDRWDSNSNAWTTIETDTGSVATTYQDTSIVSPAIDVKYRIGVINGVGVSTLSDESNTVTIPDTPLVPNNVSCTTDSSTQITVTWQVPSSDGGSALTYYNVYQPHPSNQVQYATNVYTHVATGLTQGTLYQFDVSAQNNVGDGSYASCTATTSIAPAGTFQITQDWIVYDTMEVSYLAVISAGNPSPTVEDIKIKLDGTTVATVPVGSQVSIGQQLTGTLQIKLPDLVQHDLTADMRMTNTGNEVTVTSNTLSVIATFLPTYKEVVEGQGLVAWDLTRDETQTELNIEIFKDTAPFNVNCALLTPEQASKTVDKKITSMDSHGVGSTLWQNATSVGYHNATSTVNGNLSYYVFCYEQSNPYLLMFSDVSYSTLGSALASGLSGLEADLGLMLGGPLISIFVVMLAGQATGRTAPTFIILVLVAVGILMGLGFFVIDEAIWGLILIMGSLGVLVGKKFL